MAEVLAEGAQSHLKFSDIEKKIDAFFKTTDIRKYQLHEVLYGIEESELADIISALHNCKLPKAYSSYKDVLRDKLSEYLELAPNDLIVFADGGIYIKLFFQVDSSQEAADRRACGLSPETLESYKKRFFPNDEYKEKVLEFLPHVVEESLSFKRVHPARFKKIFIPILVNTVEIIVLENSDLDDLRTIRGLTFFILREIFDDLMLYIAEDILFHFSNADRKAIEFLSFFSVHESIDPQGVRHKPNPILDESNHAWNITTIRSTMLQHRKAKQALYDKKNALIVIKKKLEAFNIEQKDLTQQSVFGREALQEVEDKIINLHRTMQKLQDTDASEVKFNENGEEKIFQRTVLLGKLFKKEDECLSERSKARKSIEELELKIINKQKEIGVWEKKYAEGKDFLASVEAHGHPMDKQYERIRRALAKTLATR